MGETYKLSLAIEPIIMNGSLCLSATTKAAMLLPITEAIVNPSPTGTLLQKYTAKSVPRVCQLWHLGILVERSLFEK